MTRITRMLFYALTVTVMLAAAGCSGGGEGGKAVAFVADEPVTVSEFRFHMSAVRAEVFAYFHQQYGAEDGAGFWEQSYGGEVPAERLKEATMDRIVDTKLILLEAGRQGYIDDPSYAGFRERWLLENERRREAIKQNRVIYGPRQLSERQFFEIELSNLQAELKKRFDEGLEVPESRLRQFYEQNPALFQTGGVKTIQRISIAYTEANKEENRTAMEELRRRIEQGLDPGEATVGGKPSLIDVEELELDKGMDQEMALRSPGQYEVARELSLGQISELIDHENRFVLLRVVSLANAEPLPYEQVKAAISAELTERQYKENMERLRDGLRIELVEQTMRSVKANV